MWFQVVFLAIFLYFLWMNLKKPENYPPGRWGLPGIGALTPFLEYKTIEEYLADMKNCNNRISGWRIGSQYVVFLSDYKLIKEAFSDPDFTNRPALRLLSILHNKGNKFGIIPSNNLDWINSRRFTMHHMRDLGMGKSRLISAVQHEANDVVNVMKKQAGKPAKLPYALSVAILNVVWKLVADTRYDLEDPKIHYFELLMRRFVLNMTRITMLDFFPWLSYVIPSFILRPITRAKVLEELSTEIRKFIEDSVKEHEKNSDLNNPHDLISAYLAEIEKQKDDPERTLSREDLIYCVADLFAAGSETTTSTLQWSIYYLATYPEVQKKLQKEIDEVIPKGTSATFDDKPKLPYLDAFTHEVLRHSALAQVGLMHMASREKQLGGFTIPEGAMLIGNTKGPHFDSKNFASPDEFRPERLIDSNGKFANPKEGFLPFGTGRRQCLGESLGRMELFIFLTTIIQNLNFDHPPNGKISLKPMDTSLIIRVPDKDQDVLITCR